MQGDAVKELERISLQNQTVERDGKMFGRGLFTEIRNIDRPKAIGARLSPLFL